MITWLIVLIAVIIGIIILVTIFKSFAKIIITLGIIYILFHVAFLWNWNDISEKINFISFFKPEYQQKVEDGINKIEDRKNETNVFNDESIELFINDSIQKAIESGSGSISKDKIIDDLKEKISGLDQNTIDEILIKLESELSEYNNRQLID